MIRKSTSLLALAGLLLAMGARPVKASDTPLSLLMGTSGFDFTLTGNGGNQITLTAGTCNGTGCIFASGSASGSAYMNGNSLYTNGTYTFWGANPILLTLTSTGSGNYTVSQNETINFSYTSGQGNLVGTLNLVSAGMNHGSGNSATATGTISLTGGSLLSWIGSNTTPSVSFTLALAGSLDSLLNTHNTMSGQVEYPSELTPVVEPASMLLFGSGLVAVGGALRRRIHAR